MDVLPKEYYFNGRCKEKNTVLFCTEFLSIFHKMSVEYIKTVSVGTHLCKSSYVSLQFYIKWI
jgi:hypothetical protein